MALALDGTPASGQFSRTNTKTVALTTTTSDDVVVVIVANENDGGAFEAVSTIADTAGLTWTLHKQLQWHPTIGNNVFQDLEIWWAHAPAALTADNIVVTLAGSTDDGCVVAFAVSGANFTTPFDTDASIPATASSVTGSNVARQVAGISTATANTFMFAAMANAQGQSESAPPSGFTSIANVANVGGHVQEYLSTDFIINSATQSSITVTAGGTGNNWGMIVSAIRIFTAAEADVVAAPAVGFGVAAAIANEKDLTVAPGFGFSKAAALTLEADLAASPAMGFSVFASFDEAQFLTASPDFGAALAAAVSLQFFGAAAPAFGFGMATTLTAQRELTIAPSLGFSEAASFAVTKRRQPVVCVIS